MKVTKRQLNLIIENYLVTEVKSGTDRYSFTNSCDMSDIEFTKGFKAIMEFRKDKNIQATNKKIREIEAAINNPNIDPAIAGPGAIDDFVAGKITELGIAKAQFAKLSKDKLGPFGFESFSGLTSPVFQNQLLKVLGFGMMLTMGPTANLYCDLVRSIVTVLNKSIDAADFTKRKKEEEVTLEFDIFYNALERIANPLINDLGSNDQGQVWAKATESLNISKNAMSLFRYIYCVTVSKIDTTGVPPRTDDDYYDKIRESARKYLGEVEAGEFTIAGRRSARVRNVTLKEDFVEMINLNPTRDYLIKNLVSFIDIDNKYGARGKVSRSNFANLSQTIATKTAEEENFYDNLLSHIKGTLNSVPG
jgi:hypothetical protein